MAIVIAKMNSADCRHQQKKSHQAETTSCVVVEGVSYVRLTRGDQELWVLWPPPRCPRCSGESRPLMALEAEALAEALDWPGEAVDISARVCRACQHTFFLPTRAAKKPQPAPGILTAADLVRRAGQSNSGALGFAGRGQ